MMAVDDDAAPSRLIFERRADHARRTSLQLRHRVVQMREAARTGIECRTCLLVGRVAVAEADDDAAIHQRAHEFR